MLGALYRLATFSETGGAYFAGRLTAIIVLFILGAAFLIAGLRTASGVDTGKR